MNRRHSMRHLTKALLGTAWLIQPEKLQQMVAFLEARARGVELTRAEVRAAFGADEDDDDDRPRTVNGVRILNVLGVLAPRMNFMIRFSGGTSTQLLGQQIEQAIKDPSVKAIVLEVDSPGGSAQGNEELAQQIMAARGKKPIVAVVRGLCASAAYYVASAADQIVATPSSEIGSIGTLLVHSESSQALEKAGHKYTIIQAGDFKGIGNPYMPLDAKARGVLQERVDAAYRQFVGAVARHRGITAAQVESDYGQGKVFLADEALRRGMIDRVATLETVLAELAAGPAPASTPTPTKENRSVNKRIKSALYALELVDSVDAADDVCQAALNAFLKSLKAERPKTDDGLLALLSKHFGGSDGGTDEKPAKPEGPEPAQVDPKAERQQERQRIAELTARRELLAESGLAISDELFQQSIDKEHTVAEAVEVWTRKGSTEEPAARPNLVPGPAAADTFCVAATDALLARFDLRRSEQPLSREAQDCRRLRLIDMAKIELKHRGRRFSDMENEDIAAMWLALGGEFPVGSMHASYQRAADFPHLLSNLAGKLLDQALEIASPTYPLWTARVQDASDLKPHPILAIGNFDELDRIGDDEKAQQLKLDEEMTSWFAVDRFANKAGLTAVMAANDDLDVFMQALQSLSVAHENTLNRMCVALAAGNVTLLDGHSLFDDTNHKNDVSSGGAPSVTEMSKMREKHRSQRGIGGKGRVRTPPRIALVPSTLETEAEQVMLPFAAVGETKVPISDATINPFRNKVIPVVEPELDDYSTTQWYTFADPRVRRTICHVFQSGYGRGGRRTSFFDPDSETRWFRLEGRFAAFVCGFRGAVRNSGAGAG